MQLKKIIAMLAGIASLSAPAANSFAGSTEMVSLTSTGAALSGYWGAFSGSGNHATFYTPDNGVPEDVGTGGHWDLYVRDIEKGTTELISVGLNGTGSNAVWLAVFGHNISADGRYVAFESSTNGIVPDVGSHPIQVLVRDREKKTTERISMGLNGEPANAFAIRPHISDSGRYVLYTSDATNIYAGDTANTQDLFLYDRINKTTTHINN